MFNKLHKVNRQINKKGFAGCKIFFKDMKEISMRYDLRWTDEDLLNVMLGKGDMDRFCNLPIPKEVELHVTMDIMKLYDERN